MTPAGRVQRRDSVVGRGIGRVGRGIGRGDRGIGRRDRELSVVVVGDVVLDRDVVGSSDRLSPDTGAPVLAVETVSQTPGGAGLTALLCGEPGVRVTLVAPVATDPPGRALAAALHRRVDLVPLAHEGGTRVKARLFARDRAMLRLDTGGSGRPLGPTAAELAALRATLATADTVLVSDYGAGMTRHPDVRRLLAEAARQRAVVWDPHPRGGPPVPGVAVVTPNLAEARVAAGGAPGAAAAELGKQLRGLWQALAVCVTEGVDGVTLVTGDGVTAVPPPTVASGDPCGAGDRFAASVGLELAAGGEVGAAVARAVADAAAWVDGIGARFRHSYGDHGPVDLGGPDPGAVAAGEPDPGAGAAGEAASPRRPTAAPPQPAPAGPAAVAARVRAAGGTVVATGGVFDVLHAGHVGYLAAARALGDALVVLLNSDDSVRRIKGPGRPVNPLADRRAVLSALSSVDAVGVFDEDDPRAALAGLRPDVWVKGGDYDPETMPETSDIRAWGGRVVVLPFLAGRSTTAILARLDADAGRAAPAGQRS